MTGLSVRGATFRAGGREILSDVSLDVVPGETLALLGPSGCGKTTLLRIIAGLETSSAGVVAFDDRDVSNSPPHRRGFGMMFQDHALFPHLDVGANVEFGLKRAHWPEPRRRERVQELLDLVGLPGFERRRIDRLSGGERQRVALARALAPEPRLLMLDEPLASLDRSLRERLAGELREILGRLAIPAIYVTHDQAEAFALADRIAIMNSGRVTRVGRPSEVWEHPETEFVARFLGMGNVVSGEREPDGWVRTAFGRFGPVAGPPGPARLLLRPEGVTLVTAPGDGVAEGIAEAVAFGGERTTVTLTAGGQRVEFSLPSSAELPARGEPACVSVPQIQELAQ